MKKDKKYFMEKLSCGISRMKRNNSVELLRGPKAVQHTCENHKENQDTNPNRKEMLTVQDMKREMTSKTQEAVEEEDDLFSLEIFQTSKLHIHKLFIYVDTYYHNKYVKTPVQELLQLHVYVNMHADIHCYACVYI